MKRQKTESFYSIYILVTFDKFITFCYVAFEYKPGGWEYIILSSFRKFSFFIIYLYLFCLILVDFVAQKKTAQQKIEDYVVSGGHTEDLIPADSCSALRVCSEEVREVPGYIGV